MASKEIQEIKEKIDIVDVISEYVTLSPAGSNFKALSPFRTEKNPSFIVSPSLQLFKDFGGDKAGDVFQFIMEIEGISFREALHLLAEKAGVKLSSYSSSSYSEEVSSSKKILLEVLESATRFYQAVYIHETHGTVAQEYLRSRGLTNATCQEFNVGFSPEKYQTLTRVLIQKGYGEEDLIQAGVSLRSAKGSVYDRFRGRIMIPIKDILGRTVGFTARVLPQFDDGKMGKYINSPQGKVFDKSTIIFGLSQAKTAIKQKDRVIIVEGQMDVMMSSQVGVKEIVAVSGTALTEYQIKTLLRYTKNFLLAFDNDSAGWEACKRSSLMIARMGGIVKIILISSGKDVADLVNTDPKMWEESIHNAQDFIPYYLKYSMNEIKSSDISGKEKSIQEIGSWISAIRNPIIKNHYIQQVAHTLMIPEKQLYSLLSQIDPNSSTQLSNKFPQSAYKSEKQISPMVKIQRSLLGYLLYKSKIDDILVLEDSLFTQKLLKQVFVSIRNYLHNNAEISSIQDLKPYVSEEEYQIIESVYFDIHHQLEQVSLTESQMTQDIQEKITLLKGHYRSSVLSLLRRELMKAKQSGDTSKVQDIVKKINSFRSLPLTKE